MNYDSSDAIQFCWQAARELSGCVKPKLFALHEDDTTTKPNQMIMMQRQAIRERVERLHTSSTWFQVWLSHPNVIDECF
jgi:hypothetical protein